MLKVNPTVRYGLMSKSQSDNLGLQGIFKQSDFAGKTALVLSTCFGAGLLPFAPGTFGTLVALPFALGLSRLDVSYRALCMAGLIALAVWSSDLSERLLKKKDPRQVVIDEVAGFLLIPVLLPLSWFTLACGFILFRLFDILKPFPIKRLEQAFKGGVGVVIDDLAAGLYAYIGLMIMIHFLDR